MIRPFGAGVEETNDYIKPMARTAVGRMERHLRDFAYVDPDRRQDPTRTHTATKSLVEYYSLCHA